MESLGINPAVLLMRLAVESVGARCAKQRFSPQRRMACTWGNLCASAEQLVPNTNVTACFSQVFRHQGASH